jgi:hypothetical protein
MAIEAMGEAYRLDGIVLAKAINACKEALASQSDALQSEASENSVLDLIAEFEKDPEMKKLMQQERAKLLAHFEALEQPTVAELNNEYLRDTNVMGLDTEQVREAQEPVAWRYKFENDLQWQFTTRLDVLAGNGLVKEELYTHPAQQPAQEPTKLQETMTKLAKEFIAEQSEASITKELKFLYDDLTEEYIAELDDKTVLIISGGNRARWFNNIRGIWYE